MVCTCLPGRFCSASEHWGFRVWGVFFCLPLSYIAGYIKNNSGCSLGSCHRDLGGLGFRITGCWLLADHCFPSAKHDSNKPGSGLHACCPQQRDKPSSAMHSRRGYICKVRALRAIFEHRDPQYPPICGSTFRLCTDPATTAASRR